MSFPRPLDSSVASSFSSKAPAYPSPVIHLRNVSSDVTQADLLDLCGKYGTIVNVLLLRSKNQALVQFQDVASATNFITASAQYPPQIRYVPVYPQFSTHAEIKASVRPSGSEASYILLCTIQNPYYDITVDVLNTIFSPYETHPRGTIEKVVIFQKSAGLQALVQFSNVDSAVRAKAALDGKNIYSNCCTLQIQYSNLTDLTIRMNSETSRDFTNPSIPEKKTEGAGLLGSGGFSRGGERCVLLVSGFPPERVGCEQLFNLFSNYGTIIRIKILFTKTNMALIQYAEGVQASQAINLLRNCRMFGGTLEITYSKFSSITESSKGASDGKTMSYEGSRLNRFPRFGADHARTLTAPTDVLHISGIPAGTSEEILLAHLQRTTPTTAVKIYEHQGKLMALAQFDSVSRAIEAMCLLHNSELGGKNIRLSFTRNRL